MTARRVPIGRSPAHLRDLAGAGLTRRGNDTRQAAVSGRDERAKRAAGGAGRAAIPAVGASAPLDTLAQLDHPEASRRYELRRDRERRRGNTNAESESRRAPLAKRARAKYLTRPIATRLAEYAKSIGHALEKSYRNSYYCSDLIEQTDETLEARYCGNRWCLVCSRIRTGKAITKYLPTIDAWSAPRFLTLTLPNVPGADLPAELARILKGIVAICRAESRGGLKVRAVRKLECTYNVRRDDYHPHLHLIVDGRDVARALLRRWLARFPAADRKAQDERPATDPRELFKYFTKLVVRSDDGERVLMPTPALHTIFSAMVGKRVYQPVGFKAAAIDEETVDAEYATLAPTREASVTWLWCLELTDWVNEVTGECLSGYEPSERVKRFAQLDLEASANPQLVAE